MLYLSFKGKNKFLRSWEDMKSWFFLIGIFILQTTARAETPIGIIGGETPTGQSYVALISPAGALTPLSIDPAVGAIFCTAINDSGYSIIVGGVSSYAALVSPTGNLTVLQTPPASILGYVGNGGAINRLGDSIIGGLDETSGTDIPYVALVSPTGNITLPSGLSTDTGSTPSVALNNSGNCIVGGHLSTGGVDVPYAALISPQGNATQLVLSPTRGIIGYGGSGVAINDAGQAIIGGSDLSSGSSVPYVALVSGTTVTSLDSHLLPSAGIIHCVAINDSGMCIIGGESGIIGNGSAYAALVSPTGDRVTPILGLPSHGEISLSNAYNNGVAINRVGTCIIGGIDAASAPPRPYAALVSPTGQATLLHGLPETGEFSFVALNDYDVGLVGGNGYAALVAPNGSLTFFPEISSQIIADVSLNNAASRIVPQAAGAYSSVINSQVAAAHSLQHHFLVKSRFGNPLRSSNEVAAFDCRWKKSMQYADEPKRLNRSLWIGPFGNYLHIDSEGKIPTFTNTIGGVLAGYDHQCASSWMVGGGLGYAFNHIHYSDDLGHGNIQEELVCLYTAYQDGGFRMNAAVFGGLYQLSNHRQANNLIVAKASTHGWIFSPHLELASPHRVWEKDGFLLTLEPFILCDYVNSWQKHYTESGRSGFNLVMPKQYTALVQTEAGLRFFEEWKNEQGTWLWQEKLSYVNQAPIHMHRVSTAFVQSIAAFPVAIGSSKVQNLGGIEISGTVKPKNRSYPNIGIDLAAALSPSYQSYYAGLHVEKSF